MLGIVVVVMFNMKKNNVKHCSGCSRELSGVQDEVWEIPGREAEARVGWQVCGLWESEGFDQRGIQGASGIGGFFLK